MPDFTPYNFEFILKHIRDSIDKEQMSFASAVAVQQLILDAQRALQAWRLTEIELNKLRQETTGRVAV